MMTPRRTAVSLPLYLVLASARAANNPDALPTPFPDSFLIPFQTNITTTEATTTHSIHTSLGGMLYYDWTIQRQRVDHAAGSYECTHFYETNEPCTLIFWPQGMYRILHSSSESTRCCLDIANLGPPPPDWASMSNPTFNGLVVDEYSGLITYQWTFDHLQQLTRHVNVSEYKEQVGGNDQYHMTRQVAYGDYAGRPVLFSFPGEAHGRQDYHFEVDKMVVGPQDPALFELPESCKDTMCKRSHTAMVSPEI
jgi:hypothetical protein